MAGLKIIARIAQAIDQERRSVSAQLTNLLLRQSRTDRRLAALEEFARTGTYTPPPKLEITDADRPDPAREDRARDKYVHPTRD